VYYREGGFGSAKEELTDAKEKDATITLKDVQAWREKFIPRKAPLRGFNSYVAPGPKHQFQMDLFEYTCEQPKYPMLKERKGTKGQRYTANVHKYGLLAVDSFTKYTHVVSLDRKKQKQWREALEEIFQKIGKTYQIYSDPDSSLLGKELKGFLDRPGIELVTTYEHANIAERTIRTIESLLDKRIEDNPRLWTAVLPEVLKKYNEKMVHSSVGMTPEEATKGSSEFDVKTKLGINRISAKDNGNTDVLRSEV
jgi:hypothetical protein